MARSAPSLLTGEFEHEILDITAISGSSSNAGCFNLPRTEDRRDIFNGEKMDEEMPLQSSPSTKEVNQRTVHFLRGVLQCPYCREYVAPKLYLCSRGNLSCVRCKICFCDEDNPKHDRRREFNMERCFILEKVYDLIPFPCKYRSIGCKTVSFGSKMKSHETECKYEPYFKCPIRSKHCSKYRFTDKELKKHLMDNHLERNLPTGEPAAFHLIWNRHYTYFLLQFNEIFICYIEKTEEKVHVSIRRLTREKARDDMQYLYEFQLLFSNKGHLALKRECMTISTVPTPFGQHDHEFTKQYLKLYCKDLFRFIVHCGVRYTKL